jgi:hypothetical protein
MQPYPRCGFSLEDTWRDYSHKSFSFSRFLVLSLSSASLKRVDIGPCFYCIPLFHHFSMSSIVSRVLLMALLAVSGTRAGSPVTCSSPQLSCQNTTIVSNTCCFNAPGGQLVQTQFWDTSPSTGETTTVVTLPFL